MASVVSGMSPAALARRKRGFLIWGVIVLLVWFACSYAFAVVVAPSGVDFATAFLSGQVFGGIFFLLGAVLFLIGFFGELGARSFNRRDTAQANELHRRLVAFSRTPRAQMYAAPDAVRVDGARIIEIERHFDQQTEGAIAGVLETSMRMFSRSFGTSSATALTHREDRVSSFGTQASTTSGSLSGTTLANLSMSQTTRADLMGDALFAVFEIDEEDTLRVVSMSAPAVRTWMAELIMAVSAHFGGHLTHAGGVVAAWVPTLTDHFGPQDVSYATDRLKAMAARPLEERRPIGIAGTIIGRNAVLVTQVHVGTGDPLEMLPVSFPGAFGGALGAPEDHAALSAVGALER